MLDPIDEYGGTGSTDAGPVHEFRLSGAVNRFHGRRRTERRPAWAEGTTAPDYRVLDPDARIELEGATTGWVGIEPMETEGIENPTLTLRAGETYTSSWSDGDGNSHNIAVHDEDGETVDGYTTR